MGLLTSIGFDTVLPQDHNHLTAASGQTLSLLKNDFFLPILVGFALLGILAGLAVVVAGSCRHGMVKQGPPVPERVTPLAEHHVTA